MVIASLGSGVSTRLRLVSTNSPTAAGRKGAPQGEKDRSYSAHLLRLDVPISVVLI